MIIARRGFKVMVIGKANAVGPTSMDGFFSSDKLTFGEISCLNVALTTV